MDTIDISFRPDQLDRVYVPKPMVRDIFGEAERSDIDNAVCRACVSTASRGGLKLYSVGDVIDELESGGYSFTFSTQ